MFEEKSKTPLGKMIERNITFAVDELKTTSERMGFIRHGLKDPDDIEGAMACLYLIETHLDELILDIKDNIERVIELDAIATGQGLFVPRTRHEQAAIEALKRAQTADSGFHLVRLPLSEVMCRAVLAAEKAFTERCESVLISDEEVSAVVEAVAEEGQEADHA